MTVQSEEEPKRLRLVRVGVGGELGGAGGDGDWSDAGLGDAGLGGELGVKGGSSIKGSDLSDDAGLSIKGALETKTAQSIRAPRPTHIHHESRLCELIELTRAAYVS